MHEVTVCKSLIRQILELCVEKDITNEESGKHLRITLLVGPLSGVVAEYLLHAYDVAKQNSTLANSELQIVEVPIRLQCLDCQAQHEATITDLRCRECASNKTQLLSGDELLIEKIEVLS